MAAIAGQSGLTAASNSFKAVSDEWLEKVRLEVRVAASIKTYEWQLGLVMPRDRQAPGLKDFRARSAVGV